VTPIPDGPFVSDRAPEAVGPYPSAHRVGNLLFISGMGPRKRGQEGIPGVTFGENGDVVAHDIEVQTRSVFDNIRYVLEDAGSSWEQIVDITVFLTDMDDFERMNAVYAEALGHVRPARTTVQVSRLPRPIHVELKVIATIG
jgi:2-aminomuconate deaminase